MEKRMTPVFQSETQHPLTYWFSIDMLEYRSCGERFIRLKSDGTLIVRCVIRFRCHYTIRDE
jgi:hypothetical protein